MIARFAKRPEKGTQDTQRAQVAREAIRLCGQESTGDTILAASGEFDLITRRQGPWNADLRTPPGPEGSNGSLLCIRRGYPGILHLRFMIYDLRIRGDVCAVQLRRPNRKS